MNFWLFVASTILMFLMGRLTGMQEERNRRRPLDMSGTRYAEPPTLPPYALTYDPRQNNGSTNYYTSNTEGQHGK
jgi:hypothetical protein